jgi:hypothetical protein
LLALTTLPLITTSVALATIIALVTAPPRPQ